MKTLYLECNMGAAGDMLTAALLELHPHPESIIEQLNRAGIPQVTVSAVPSIKCGIKGTHYSVSVNGEHECSCDVGNEPCEHPHEAHSHEHSGHEHTHDEHGRAHGGHGQTSADDIKELIDSLPVSEQVRGNVLAVYDLIAAAAGCAHDGQEHSDAESSREHDGHEHPHGGHSHEHGEHEHFHEERGSGHEHKDHSHEHTHEEHEHSSGNHGHIHESHSHEYDEHEHPCESQVHGRGENAHSRDEHEHAHEGCSCGGHEHTHDGHEHRHLSDIAALINGLTLPAPVRENMLAVYTLIAEAECRAHDSSITQIHFHEVGAMDAVADIAAVCLLIHELAPDIIAASPVRVGSGQVRCAHGIIPVPAPATAHLLRGIPSYGGQVRGELCTPTGAALLRHFAQSFGPQPLMRVEKIGYGMGDKDFPQANCLRAMLGEDAVSLNCGTDCADNAAMSCSPAPNACPRDSVVELSCNLDDMTPEEIGFAVGRLWEAGALDVYTVGIGMKKNRPGVMLCCLCREEQREALTRLFFLHTTTLGVRETVHKRSVLQRTEETRESSCGSVRVKKACGWGVQREKAEYGDLAEIARRRNLSLRQINRLL